MREFLETIARELGASAQAYARKGVTRMIKENPTDFVTEADKALSERFITVINEQYPGDAILSEEDGVIGDSAADVLWVIDPIDGTANFASGIPTWAVMIARKEHGKTTHATVYFPDGDQLYYADESGAYHNGQAVTPSTRETFEYAKGVCKYHPSYQMENCHAERFRTMMKQLTETDVKIACYRAAATACYAASGGIDFYAGNLGKQWDLEAPIYICQQAGLKVTDTDGNPWDGKRDDMVIANSTLHKEVMNLFA